MTTEPSKQRRLYQVEAVEAIAAALTEGGRGQLHAACGSGKTLIGAWTAQRLLPTDGLVVVLVPSLALVAQNITEWRTHTRVDAVLAVCSDDTVTDAPTHLTDIDAETTTDPDKIAAWLRTRTGRRLIVSTYVSSGKLAAALRDNDTAADLVILDEAHHLAGRPDLVTRRVLDERHLPARRRLFMTATPRTDALRAESTGALTMDDQTLFGPVLYRYPFPQAIRDGHLDDYRIAVMGITESKAWEMLRTEGTEYVDRAGGPSLKVLVAQALVAKAARTWNLRRVLAFCPRVQDAEEFTKTMASTVRRLPSDERPKGGLFVGRVTGEMNQTQRELVLDALRTPPQTWSVVSNVRCLGEGVDVPAVDAVAFCHPKSSQVDIVQAVGRALRRSPTGSGTATIIVPIVIPDSDQEVGDLDPGEFRVLWQVVRALRAHDDSLGIELDTQRAHDPTSNPGLPDRISITLPPGTSDRVLTQLKALTVKQTTSLWWEGYARARAYRAEHGHLDVPNWYVTADDFRLGRWIVNSRQQRRKGWMSEHRIEALDDIGMIWDTRVQTWSRFLEELKAFKGRSGHLRVPQTYVSPTGYNLGTKVNATRTRRAAIPAHVREQLDDLGMIWDARDLEWQRLFAEAQTYHAEYGHLRVPKAYRTVDGYGLGSALDYRRKKAAEGTLDPAEKASLDEFDPAWWATGRTDPWQELLAACDRYVDAHGSLAGVTKAYVDEDGYRLGAAISYYRNLNNGTKKGRDGVPAQRKAELDSRGMVWRNSPARDITDREADGLAPLRGEALGREVLRLVDEEHVTQSSIAEALGTHRSYLNSKVKQFRSTGEWPDRGRYRSRTT